MADKRKYVKKSEYWNRNSQPVASTMGMPSVQSTQAEATAHYGFDGSEHYSAFGACGGGDVGSTRGYRDSGTPTIRDVNSYRNLRSGLLPFEENSGYASVTTAIDLVNRAYFNVAVVRNAINTMVDLSISKLKVAAGNTVSQTFIKAWLRGINVSKLMSQFFLEYYRSSNVFMYKFNGSFNKSRLNELKSISSAAKADPFLPSKYEVGNSSSIPIRYTILNPAQVYLQKGAVNTNTYAKVLSTFEINRLRVRATEEDKQIFQSLPKTIQESIDAGGNYTNLYIPLDPKRLFFAFNRKQDYEPMAVPMIFPILNDVEWKLELKKMDMALSRTVEQVILMVTTGRNADQYNQAGGAKNQAILQDLFKNQSIGRVLVADHTTKAEWIIPDLKEILGSAKYERVDNDIKEGLQYVLFGSDDKFANASIKARILVEGLEEGRRVFIEDFLQPEIGRVCEVMGFKNVPKVELGDINVQDEAVMSKVYVQMAQLGFLTPEELYMAMENGILPTPSASIESQKALKKMREDGLYAPMLNNGNGGLDGQNSPSNGRPAGTKGKPGSSAPKKAGKIGKKAATKASIGFEDNEDGSDTDFDEVLANDASEEKFSFGALKVANVSSTFCMIEEIVKTCVSKHFKAKELNAEQEGICQTIAKYLGLNEIDNLTDKEFSKLDKKKCIALAKQYISKPVIPTSSILSEIDEICAKFDVDGWVGAILYKAQI